MEMIPNICSFVYKFYDTQKTLSHQIEVASDAAYRLPVNPSGGDTAQAADVKPGAPERAAILS